MRLIPRPERFAAPFPAEKRVEVRQGRGLAAAWDRWRSQPIAPFRVIARLAAPVSMGVTEAVHLDAVLSWAAHDKHGPYLTRPPLAPLENCVLPLPLGLVWVDAAGLPLWAASDLVPIGPAAQSVVYVHRRYPEHREPLQRERGANTAAGRWKDARIPQRVTVCERLEAVGFGDLEEVADLLLGLSHVGKKAAHGRGRVATWEVTPAPCLTLEAVMERRPTPVRALAPTASVSAGRLGHGGYTPPYWDARRHGPVRTAVHG